MIDRAFIGRSWAPPPVDVEKGRIRMYVKAIGETASVHTDDAAAKAAGYRGLLAPPTFALTLETEALPSEQWLAELGIDIARVLHGEQRFEYHAPICSGDTLAFTIRVSDIYDKKGGALEFVVVDSDAVLPDGTKAASFRKIIVIRN